MDRSIGVRGIWAAILITGFIEEIVFRGFVLECLRNMYSFQAANIISSLLFLVAHIPYWIAWHQFALQLPTVLYGFTFTSVRGLLEGFFLKKTDSLWTCIIHHSTNNFLAFMVK